MYKYIYEMKRRGALAIGEADNEELAEESLSEDEIPSGELEDSSEPNEEEDATVQEDIQDEEVPEVEPEPAEPVEEEKTEPVSKVQTLDIINLVMGKFDQYMEATKINWDAFINNGKITNTPNFAFLDDLYNLLNNTLDEKVFEFIPIYNTLFENMTDTKFTKNLSNYGREKYGKPFLAEGMALLLYELSIDWAIFLARYFKELPSIQSSEDSFVRKFPNLRLLTYIAKLFNDSNEFAKLIKDDKARELLANDTKYTLTTEQAKKKPRLYRANGESLSYFASLIRFSYADIMVGAVDKLGVVAFLTSKQTEELHQRLTIIRELIKVATSKGVATPNSTAPVNSGMSLLETRVLDLLKQRTEARLMLDMNERNFPMKV